MSQQFFQRVANYVANEVIVKGLANSRTFQRFVVRADKQYQNIQQHGTEHLSKTVEELAKTTSGVGGAAGTSSTNGGVQLPQRPLRGIPGFVAAFFKEIRKDITGA